VSERRQQHSRSDPPSGCRENSASKSNAGIEYAGQPEYSVAHITLNLPLLGGIQYY
jgi:hypothetical protein